MQDKSQGIPYEVVHKTAGRIRLRVPSFKSSQDFADRLQQRLASHAGVTEVRLNTAANSVIITYRPKIISEHAIQEQIHRDIQQAGGIPSTVAPAAKPAPAAEPASEKPTQVDSSEIDGSSSLEPSVGELSAGEPPVGEPPADQSFINEPAHEQSPPLQTEPLNSPLLQNELSVPEAPEDVPEEPEDTSKAEPILLVSKTESEAELKTESDEPEHGSEEFAATPSAPPPVAAPVSQQSASQPELASEQSMKLSQRMLAKRLHVSSSSLRQQRTQPNFSVWSAAKDPEGKGWQYDPKSGCFYPAIPDEVTQ